MGAGEQSASGQGGLKRWLYDLMYKASPRMRVVQACAMGLSLIAVIASVLIMNGILQTRSEIYRVSEAHGICQDATDDLQNTSD